MPRGGRRPGAGRKRDTTSSKAERVQKALEKEVLREQARAIIAPHLKRLLTAQIANASGLKYLVVRDKKTGKFLRVTESVAKAKLNADTEEILEVWEKDPSTHAFTELLNRLLDKSAEQDLTVKVSGAVTIADRVAKARARLAAASKDTGATT